MSILKRVLDVTRAAAHEALNKLEDPVMMLNHYTRQMEEELEDAQEALRSHQAVERSAKLRHEEYARLAEHLDGKAAEALAEGREAEARTALAEKLVYAEKAAQYLAWHQEAKLRTEEQEQRLAAAKAELERTREKRNELIARARKAEVRTDLPSFGDVNGGTLDGGSAARGFRRMEEKIMYWEAEAEVRGAQQASHAAVEAARAAQIEEQLSQLRSRQAESSTQA
jgi:phage shock protein A